MTTNRSDEMPVPARRVWAAVALGLMVAQVCLAGVMLFSPRPAPYGWQMYSAVPQRPDAWAIRDDVAEPIDVASRLVHDRVEINFARLLRERGCDWTGAEVLRIELNGGAAQEIACR